MDAETRRRVRERAGGRCEYCHLPVRAQTLQQFHIEHITPIKHGGTDDDENLAVACIDCNLHKGSNLTGIDPETGRIVVLFNPRSQDWDEHFAWNGFSLDGVTDVGRPTI